MRRDLWFPCLLVGAVLVGCNDDKPAVPTSVGPDAAGAKYILASEPANALGIIDARKKCKDGDEVVVVGRIGGSVEPFIEGKARFTIVDQSFKPCNERGDDNCATPWDYCCDAPELLKEGTISVKFTDGEGNTVATDARKLLGLRELNTVVVKGKAQRDKEGNMVVLATGLFKRADAKK